jgi:hypothetical protein
VSEREREGEGGVGGERRAGAAVIPRAEETERPPNAQCEEEDVPYGAAERLKRPSEGWSDKQEAEGSPQDGAENTKRRDLLHEWNLKRSDSIDCRAGVE